MSVPVKPETNNPIEVQVYNSECEDYILKYSDNQSLDNFITHIEVELTMRKLMSARQKNYSEAMEKQKKLFMEEYHKEMYRLKEELEAAKLSLRKAYMAQKEDEESESESESEEMPKVVKRQPKKKAPQKKGKSKTT